jgi:hypothetical protein
VHQFELVWDRYELAALSIHQALGQWILEKSSGGLYECVTSLEVAVIAFEYECTKRRPFLEAETRRFYGGPYQVYGGEYHYNAVQPETSKPFYFPMHHIAAH